MGFCPQKCPLGDPVPNTSMVIVEIEAPTRSSNPTSLTNGILAKTHQNPKYEVTLIKVGKNIQYMRHHSLIDKFLGLHPSRNSLFQCITSRWKDKGQMELKLGSKYLFIVIFNYAKDRENGQGSNH